MTPPTMPATTSTPSAKAQAETPPPPTEMKCTLCGLSACWTEKEGAASRP